MTIYPVKKPCRCPKNHAKNCWGARAITHWGRQMAAILCGCAFGLMGATGWRPTLTFFAVTLGLEICIGPTCRPLGL